MSEFTFEPATREQAKARIALAGPSGSGKTMTALIVATALGSKIAVIDTERGSASKYAPPPSRMKQPGPGEFLFDRLDLHRYDPRDMAKALASAAKSGHDVVVVDSMSKFWSGAGGMLEQVDNAAKRSYGNNSFGGWKEARPMESAMIEALLGYPGHVIVTMRTKTAYEIIEDDRGRKVPTKLGLKPEQREGIEYEFDIVGDMDLQNALTVSKSRCPALSGMVIQRPDSSLGEEILAWLTDGKPMMSATDYRDALCAPGLDAETIKGYGVEIGHRGMSGAALMDDEGNTVTLRELALRKYQEATHGRNGRAAPAQEPPATAEAPAGASGNGAARETPPTVTDQEWLTGFTSKAVVAPTASEVEMLRMELQTMLNNGGCTGADAGSLTELLDARYADLEAEAEAGRELAGDGSHEAADEAQGVLA